MRMAFPFSWNGEQVHLHIVAKFSRVSIQIRLGEADRQLMQTRGHSGKNASSPTRHSDVSRNERIFGEHRAIRHNWNIPPCSQNSPPLAGYLDKNILVTNCQ